MPPLCGTMEKCANTIHIHIIIKQCAALLNQFTKNYEKKFKMAVHGNGYSCDECFVCKLR